MGAVSRRAALQGLTTLGSLMVLGRARLLAQPAPVVRRDVTELQDLPDELKRYDEAVRALRGVMNAEGRTAWELNADGHRLNCSNQPGLRDIHGTWWFLPWHRAYLHATERNLQKAAKDPEVALPYWHWSFTPQVPEIYKSGALCHTRLPYAPIAPWRLDLTGMRAPSFRGRLEGTDVIELAFGGISATPRELRSSIEGTPHGQVHNVVGGDMGRLARAAHDPLFFAHHANIDRLWELWRGAADSAHSVSEPWQVEGFADTFEFFDVDSDEPYRVSVAQTRNTIDLGYTYSTPEPPMAMVAFDETHSKPDPKLLGSQTTSSSVSAAGRGGLQSLAPEKSSDVPGRAILTLRNVEIPAEDGVTLAVYLTKATQTFNPNDAVFAGSIGVVATGSNPTKATFALDVTMALEQLKPSGDSIHVTVVPVRTSEDDPEPKPLEIEKIELYVP